MKYSFDNYVKNNIELVGRYSISNDGISFYHNYSGIRFLFSGLSLKLNISYIGSPTYFRVVIDDDFENAQSYKVDETTKEINIVFPSSVNSEIGIYKVNENADGNIKFISIETEGEISLPQPRKHQVEVIGDSTVAGFGILGKCSDEAYDPFIHSDGMKSSFALALQSLKLYPCIFSASGWGVYGSHWTEDHYKSVLNTINQVSGTVDINWDNKYIDPSLIIISLGTNDCSLFIEGDEEKELAGPKLISSYLQLIDLKMKQYPNAKILIVDGTLNRKDVYFYTHQVYELANKKYPNKTYEAFIEGDGVANGYHSTLSSQIKMSKELEAIINKLV